MGLEVILGGVVAALMAVVGAWFAGQRKGRVAEKHKQEVKRADAMRDQKEVRDEVDGMDDYRARSELDRWLRKGDG